MISEFRSKFSFFEEWVFLLAFRKFEEKHVRHRFATDSLVQVFTLSIELHAFDGYTASDIPVACWLAFEISPVEGEIIHEEGKLGHPFVSVVVLQVNQVEVTDVGLSIVVFSLLVLLVVLFHWVVLLFQIVGIQICLGFHVLYFIWLVFCYFFVYYSCVSYYLLFQPSEIVVW